MGRRDIETETFIPVTGGFFDAVPVAHVDALPAMRAGASSGGVGHGARSGDSKDEYVVPMVAGTLKSCGGKSGTPNGAEEASRLIPVAIHPACIGRSPTAGPQGKEFLDDGSMYTLGVQGGPPAVSAFSGVRRLTPLECERLQGFPDHYTAITVRNKPAADGPRYKALGNSMAVPVMTWLGERIATVNNLS